MQNKVALIVRIFMGLVFFIFGLNGFLHFIPLPPLPAAAGAFMEALVQTGYMFPLIKGVEVICGLMLLSNLWTPLALALLAPNIVNIVLFHAFLAPAGLPLPIVLLAAELFLTWAHRSHYQSMLQMR